MYKIALNHVSILALTASLAGTVVLAQDTINMPVLPNTEPETGPVGNDAGFVLSLDGVAVDADPQVEDRVRKADIALANADVQIQLDANDPVPQLDVEIAGTPRRYAVGDQISLISETNYPAFVVRGEMRIIDRGAQGGPRLLATIPVAANGQASVIIPEGRDIVVVHRVYDARGRYDETQALSLLTPDDRGQVDDVEEGSQFTANRNIPLASGATVTVSATNVPAGAVLETMGESIRPDRNGRLVINRILPPGEHVVDVDVTGGGQNIGLTRPIQVPGSEWFYVFVADLTYGRYSDELTDSTYTSATGRLQYYVEGETENGVQITSSLDTGEHELDEIFERLGDKDPNAILDRIDPNSGYATYGDDSTIVDHTPTSGRFYLRIEKDNNFGLWGDYQAQLTGNTFVRNERSLYGAQVHLEADTTTERGDIRTSLDVYAAQPDQAIGRDVFEGTGGSVYFLSAQDIQPGTQTVTVELRDAVTNRVIDRVTLVEGRDYQINAIQGLITLNEPLTNSLDRRVISTNVSGDEAVNLIVQYEYSPTTADVDSFSYGGRVEHWLSDDLRVGLSGTLDDDGVNEQQTVGADIRYELGDNSFVQLDYAQSSGSGFETSFSADGGLDFATDGATRTIGEGEAIKLEAQFELSQLGIAREGIVGGYFETRTEGFTALDYNVTATTGDETLYGLFLSADPEEGRLAYNVYADVYENGVGDERLELGAEIAAQITDQVGLVAAVEYLDETDISAATAGSRTDLALELTYAVNDSVDIYAFGQGTIVNDGLANNERYGIGAMAEVSNGWELGAEVSDGYGGLGAELFAVHTQDDNSSTYFGYELDPARTLTGIEDGFSSRDNGGRYVIGSRRQINEDVSVFGENTYDIFGDTQELIGAYGVTYSPRDFLSYTASFEQGSLRTSATDGDIDRQALSFGVRYEDNELRAAGRIEARFDDYEDPAIRDTQSFFAIVDADYRITEEKRLIFNLDYAATQDSDSTSFEEGTYIDAVLGYAYRPIDNERLNLLASYRYFYDTLGQEIDGVASAGPVQESHVLSVEANYDLNQNWTIAGKVGGRWTESAPTAGDLFTSNDAWLVVANARYHLVHRWDLLLEGRHLELVDGQTSDTSFLGAAYYHVNNNASIGVGYNFGEFSDDLTDLTFDDDGVFVNLVAKF
ncbi:hypothetical protein Q4555_13285 [Octadecabacter sp. 1_MG-2023]|uniref:hypothetical protein n=1 Tax=unclassified Octadecabacter TaxID=196158 RepID=UPI001C096F56|nr:MULTISPECIES: hypothetical protein [unclassified Octadecabacter]MBU2991671.1 hypothetical protein [Octadecabacter sp. B2R22]MDO6735644.1 hypothetical protein [Octadecabacter sp. 1_MG-2023]